MGWVRPSNLKIKPGEPFLYTNTGEHAIHQPNISRFEGIRNAKGNWFTLNKHKPPTRMGEPQFIWVDDLEKTPVKPEPYSDWRHRNGNIYSVLLITNLDSANQSKYPTTVVYVNKSNGKWYSRPLADWHRSMTEITE